MPLCWLAMLPIASLPASIRARLQVEGGAPVAAVVSPAVAAPAAIRDAPAALAVPESAPVAMIAEEVPPQDLSRTVGSFGSATSAGSFSAFSILPDFQLDPSLNGST